MESTKLSFTSSEVNELIGGVPKRILQYCLVILVLIMAAIGLMVSITPYPKNLLVNASISKEMDNEGTAGNLPSNMSGKLVCKIQLGKNRFNKSYLKNAKKVSVSIKGVSKSYRLAGDIFNISVNKDNIVAKIKLKNDGNLKEFLKSEARLLKQPLQVEVTNNKFSIKDKLVSNLSLN